MNRWDRFAFISLGIFWGIIIVSPVLLDLGIMPGWSYGLLWVWPLVEVFFGHEWCHRGPRWERKRKLRDDDGEAIEVAPYKSGP